MYLALLLLLCAGIVLFNTWRGWRGGALAQLFTLGILLLSYGSAGFIGYLGLTAPFLNFVPRLAQPYVLGALVALVLYAILTPLARRALYRMDAAAVLRLRAEQQAVEADALARGEQPPVFGALDLRPVTNSPANRGWGGAIGALKGVLLAGVLLLAVQFLGSVALALGSLAPTQPPARRMARGSRASRGSVLVAPGIAPEPPAPSPLQSVLQQLGREIRKTPVGAVADKVSPVKSGQIEAMGKLSKLAEDPEALERLRLQPQIQELAKNPRIRALSNDPVIARAVKEQRWNDLLNAPAVVALARDPEIRRQFQTLNLDELTRKAEGRPRAQKPSEQRTERVSE